jgi:hypothetical protein
MPPPGQDVTQTLVPPCNWQHWPVGQDVTQAWFEQHSGNTHVPQPLNPANVPDATVTQHEPGGQVSTQTRPKPPPQHWPAGQFGTQVPFEQHWPAGQGLLASHGPAQVPLWQVKPVGQDDTQAPL